MVTSPIIQPNIFLHLGKEIMNRNKQTCLFTDLQHFESFFGAHPSICSVVWNKFVDEATIPKGGQPYHLLWDCMFLKTYNNEACLSSTVGVDEKTFRKWNWLFVKAISDLEDEVVSTPIPF